jgi:hypothetical protein
VTPSTSSPSANFDFTVAVTISDSNSATTTDSCAVTLSESGGATVSGTASLTFTGSSTFTIYLSSTGSKTIVATCGTVTGNSVITVMSDYLKITSYTPLVNDK